MPGDAPPRRLARAALEAAVLLVPVALFVLLDDDGAAPRATPGVVDLAPERDAATVVPRAPDDDAVAALPAPAPTAEAPLGPARDELVEAVSAVARAREVARGGPVDVAVRVLGPEGAPRPDVALRVWRERDALDARQPGPESVTWTDAAGRADLRLPTGRAVLEGSLEGFGSTGVWSVRALARAADADGVTTLVLRPDAVLELLVLHADDRPAAGATLGFGRTGAALSGRVPPPTTVDADGRARLDVDGDTALVVVARLGDLATRPTPVEVPAGATTEHALRLPGRWSVAVRLLDAEDEPVPEGAVEAWLRLPGVDAAAGVFPDDEGVHLLEPVDAGGLAVIDLPRPGEYVLLGSRDGAASGAPVTVHVDDGSPRADATLHVLPAARIAGRLVDGEGAPLPGVRVHARPAHLLEERAQRYAPTVWRLHGQASDTTTDDGAFDLGPLHPDGRYIVFCRPVDGRPDLKLVVRDVRPDGPPLRLVADDVTLQRATLDGTVLSDATGAPLEAFVARLVIELDGRVITTEDVPLVTGPGTFRFEGLAPGYRYRLRGEAPGHGAAETAWFTAERRGRHETLRLPAGGRLEVRVVDRLGRPVGFASVSPRRAGGDFGPEAAPSRRTDESGRVAWDGVAPGAWTLRVVHGGFTTDTAADVPSGDRVEVVARVDG